MKFKSLIYSKDWLDVVFANRNKEYGAYQLRQMSNKATNTALLIVISVVLGVCGLSFIAKESNQVVNNVTEQVLDDDIMMHEVIIEEKIIEPEKVEAKVQQVAQDVSARDLIKFTEIKPTNSAKITEDIAEESEVLNKKNLLASINMKGIKGGELITRGTFGNKKRDGGSIGRSIGDVDGEDGEGKVFEAVEIMPEPKEGMPNFVKWIGENYSYPQSALDNNVQGLIQVKFVVEKDGSLSSFEVLRDMGFGTGNEAIKLLKKTKRWNPGVQNGIPVRVTFTLPIRLSTL